MLSPILPIGTPAFWKIVTNRFDIGVSSLYARCRPVSNFPPSLPAVRQGRLLCRCKIQHGGSATMRRTCCRRTPGSRSLPRVPKTGRGLSQPGGRRGHSSPSQIIRLFTDNPLRDITPFASRGRPNRVIHGDTRCDPLQGRPIHFTKHQGFSCLPEVWCSSGLFHGGNPLRESRGIVVPVICRGAGCVSLARLLLGASMRSSHRNNLSLIR